MNDDRRRMFAINQTAQYPRTTAATAQSEVLKECNHSAN
jgi:hypothetical protein